MLHFEVRDLHVRLATLEAMLDVGEVPAPSEVGEDGLQEVLEQGGLVQVVVTNPEEGGSATVMSVEEQEEIVELVNTSPVVAPRMRTAVGRLLMAQVEEERWVWGTTGLGRDSP